MNDELIQSQREFLATNPDYRKACFAAWKCGEETFRLFMANDEVTRKFITRELPFLTALFELPEFR